MKDRRRKAFTLVELLVVILIITMLAALLTPRIFKAFGKSKQGLAKIGISKVETALNQFYMDCGRFPTGAEGLQALVESPPGLTDKWDGVYCRDKELIDPWDNPYRYRIQQGVGGDVPYVIFSYGGDNAEGGDGENADISSEDL